MSKSNLYNLFLVLFLSASCEVKENKVKINVSAIANATLKIKTSKLAFNRDSVFLDSIICHINIQDSTWIDSLTFYYDGHSYVNTYPNLSYSRTIDTNNFQFLQWNNDSFLDLSYYSNASGQGCFNSEIFLYNPDLGIYKHSITLSEECSLTFNPKLNIYSTYSRGGGQSGPWSYEIFSYEKEKKYLIERLLIEKDYVEQNEKFKWTITHYYNGKTHTYKYILSKSYFNLYKPPMMIALKIKKLKKKGAYFHPKI